MEKANLPEEILLCCYETRHTNLLNLDPDNELAYTRTGRCKKEKCRKYNNHTCKKAVYDEDDYQDEDSNEEINNEFYDDHDEFSHHKHGKQKKHCNKNHHYEHEEECHCSHKCNVNQCFLGKKLILSGAAMEADLGAFLAAEGRKIDKAASRFGESRCSEVTIEDLIKLNTDIKDTICCLSELEEKILAKIKLGEKMLKCKNH